MEQWEMGWNEIQENKFLVSRQAVLKMRKVLSLALWLKIMKNYLLQTSTSLDTSRTFLSVRNSMLIELPLLSVWALGCYRLHYPQWVSRKIMNLKNEIVSAFPRLVAVYKSAVQAAQDALWISQGLYEYECYYTCYVFSNSFLAGSWNTSSSKKPCCNCERILPRSRWVKLRNVYHIRLSCQASSFSTTSVSSSPICLITTSDTWTIRSPGLVHFTNGEGEYNLCRAS